VKAEDGHAAQDPTIIPHHGDPLTIDDSKSSYVLIRHNIRTYVSAGVVEVIHGRQNAEAVMREYQNRQSSPDAHEGWRYFLEKSGLRAGMDPAQATDARQRDLEIRESKESAGNGNATGIAPAIHSR
jgi:hypothetical protein